MTGHAIEKLTLPNGLRVVLCPDRSAPVVGVAVVYDVGSRSEPADRAGFAHLFEHLAFQGSARFGKGEHARLVQGAGGTFNGSTRPDHTEYHQTVPAPGLATVLELEADRMRGLALTEENLRNQVDVVSEEIRTHVLNRPYGGFPDVWLAPVLFDTFANAHDGYGSFEELRAATVADAADFFERYYSPANAVLCVVGDFAVDEAVSLVREHFSPIPARPAPVRPDLDEPDLAGPRRLVRTDPRAPLPAVAVGRRAPDPADLARSLPCRLLAAVLKTGDRGRLVDRLVRGDGLAVDTTAVLGLGGDPFAVRAPTGFVMTAVLSPGGDAGQVLTALEEELARAAAEGVGDDELARVRRRCATALLQGCDSVAGRAVRMAVLEQQRGDAALLADLPRLLGEVTAAEVAKAAADLVGRHPAVLEVVPG